MANEIDALLARVDDSALRNDLKTQFDRLRQKRQFGLVFEEHLPERVTLPHHTLPALLSPWERMADQLGSFHALAEQYAAAEARAARAELIVEQRVERIAALRAELEPAQAGW